VPQLSRLKAGRQPTVLLPGGQCGRRRRKVREVRSTAWGWNVPIVLAIGVRRGGPLSPSLPGPSAEKVHFIQTFSFLRQFEPQGGRRCWMR